MEAKPARYVIMTISCSEFDCQERQVIHVRARAAFAQIGPQVVECLKCHKSFEVMIPDEIIGGPFSSVPLETPDLTDFGLKRQEWAAHKHGEQKLRRELIELGKELGVSTAFLDYE